MRLRESAVFELEPIPPYSFKHTVSKNTKYGTDWYLFTPFEKYYIRSVKEYAQEQFGEWQSYVYDYVVNDLGKIKTVFMA